MAHITTLTRAYNDLHNSQANTYSYSGSFETFKESEVRVKLAGVDLTYNSSPSDNTQYSVNLTDKTIHVGGGNLTSGTLSIFPVTDLGDPTLKAPYSAGSAITASDITNNQLQVMRKAMEFDANKLDATGGTLTGDLILGQNVNIQYEGSADDAYETTVTVTNPTADRTITLPNITGTVITTGDTGTVTSTMINDGTIVNADVNASAAIAGTKISPDFGSQNIATTGTVNGVSTTELSILDGATVTTNELNILDGVTATASELNILDGVTATATELNIIDGVTATTAELNHVDGVTSGIQAQIDGKQPLDSELTELATMGSGTASSLADLNSAEVQTLDGLTSSTAELNLLDGKSIVTTIGGSATDVQIPSAQAVNERIVELVTEVGGFHPIANETSFPTTNPDINDGAGTIVSVKALASNLTSSGSGVATISNGAGSGNTVTINGMANSDTIEAGKGILVETTTTLHTYTFHREVIDPAGVTNASSLVSDFNDRYQVSGSAPSNHPDGSALGDGDLWFDTSANVMKVYDLGNTQYNTVASVGDFKLLTVVPDGATSGSPTFDGNIVSYDLRDASNAASITNVGQLFVSLNGVIQKPNAGSYNASNEGFYLEGTNGIKFCTAPASGSSLYVTQIGAATGIGTPSDNTVTEAKLQSDAVSEAKLKVSNSPVNGYFLSAQSGNTGGLTWAAGDFLPTTGGTVSGVLNAFGGILLGSNDTIKFDSDDADTNHISFKGPLSLGSTVTYTLPEDGSNGQHLITNGSGVLSFSSTLNAANLTGTLPAIDGSNLTGLQAGATGGNSGGNAVFWENQQTVTHDYSISANRNAGSFGPITINNGITVTVPSTSNWTIV